MVISTVVSSAVGVVDSVSTGSGIGSDEPPPALPSEMTLQSTLSESVYTQIIWYRCYAKIFYKKTKSQEIMMEM